MLKNVFIKRKIQNKKARWKRRVFFLLGFCFLFITTVYVYRISILLNLGQSVIYQDTPESCDAIVLLGGGGPIRAERAVELYQKGYANKIFITLVKEPESKIPNSDIINMESLEVQSVFYENKIENQHLFWCDVPMYSTFQEAQYVRYWLEKHGYKKAMIVTGLFQSQRAKWTFDFFMEGSGIQIYIIPSEQIGYSAHDWWNHIDGIIFVENELFKSIYYYFRFLFNTPEPYQPVN